MMLSLTKRIVEADRAIRREILDRNIFMGHDLFGQTVGIIGLGNVGKRLAQLCNGLFPMRVLAYDPYVSAEVMKQNNVEKVDLDTLMREARLRLDQLPAHRREPRTGRREAICADEAERLFRHDRARQHP